MYNGVAGVAAESLSTAQHKAACTARTTQHCQLPMTLQFSRVHSRNIPHACPWPVSLRSCSPTCIVPLPAGTTVALGQLFHAHPLKVLGAVISCCQVAVWLFVAGMTVYKGLAGDLFHPPCLAPPPPDKDLTAAASDLERRLSQVTGSQLDAAAMVAVRQHLAAYSSGQFDSAYMAPGAVPPGLAGSFGSTCLPHQLRARG